MENKGNLQIKIKRFLKKSGYPEFLHRFGPKTYKLIDHISSLLIMQSCQLSLRRVSFYVKGKCPTYSALCKSRKRIPLELWQKLLKITSGLSSGKIAIDGTGFSRANPSFHYLKRIDNKSPQGSAKLSALFDIQTKKFLVMRIRSKPKHDMRDVNYMLKRTPEIRTFYADKGYDSEEIHELCYWNGIQTFIPPKKHVRLRKFRRLQMKNWDKEEYNLRSNIEAGFSAMKRKYGSSVRAKKAPGLRSEIICKGIAYNLNLC